MLRGRTVAMPQPSRNVHSSSRKSSERAWEFDWPGQTGGVYGMPPCSVCTRMWFFGTQKRGGGGRMEAQSQNRIANGHE